MSTGLSTPAASFVDGQEWRRLSPRMLAVHPVKELGRALPGLLVLLFAGSSSGHGALWGLVGAAVVTVLSISRWFTTRYRVSAEQVQIREGLFRRRTLAARLDRVRTVDVTSHALHRALGLARVEIGTGVSDRKGRSVLRLDGLPAEQAARLRGELLHEPQGHPRTPFSAVALDVAPPEEVEIARLDPSWVRFAPFTFSGVFTGLAIAGFAWRIQSEGQVDLTSLGPLHSITRQVENASLWVGVVEVLLGVVAFIVIASTAGYVLAFWNFRLTRHSGGSFHVSRGLLTTRGTSIEVSRLRGVGISESLPMRLIGGARTAAIATGLQVGRGASAQRGGTVLLPDAPIAEARRVAGILMEEPQLVAAPVLGHGPTAVKRRFTRGVGAAVLVVAATRFAWWVLDLDDPWWMLSLVLMPLACLVAADRARNLGHIVTDRFLVRQAGSLVRRRAMLETDAIIGWNLRQSLFQRRAGIATLTATTAAGRQSYQVLDVPLTEAHRIADAATPGLFAQFSRNG